MKKIAKNMVLCALMTMSLSAVCAAEEAAVPAAEPQVTVASTTQAQPNQTVVDWLAPAAGDWYNTKGDLVLTVEAPPSTVLPLQISKTTPTAILVKGSLPFVNRPGIES